MPEQEKLRILFRMLITITREEEEKRLEEVLQSMHIPIFFQARGQGTAPSEILDLFGLGGHDADHHHSVCPQIPGPTAFGVFAPARLLCT